LLAGVAVLAVAVLAAACTNKDNNVAQTGNPPLSGASSGGLTTGGAVTPNTSAVITFKALDSGGPLTEKAIKDGTVQIGELFSVNPAIKSNGWVVLQDDKHLQAADHFAAAVRTTKASDQVNAVLNAVDAKLTQDAVQGMLEQVSANGQNPDDVAKKWLQDENLPGDLKATGSITVGTANFAESEVVGQIYAEALRAAGVNVSTKTDIGARAVYIPALERGDIDVIPEFTASLLAYLDPNAKPSGDLDEVYDQVKNAAAAKGITVLKPAPADDVNVFVVTKQTSEKYHLTTLSDLAKVSEPLTLGGAPECVKNAQCLPGLEQVYGLKFKVS
jgi:osmoprotectant transport system substrate-binding protein